MITVLFSRWLRQLRWRRLSLLLPLLLAACATAKDGPVHYPPAPGSYFNVRVRSGDTLSELAYRYQVKEDDLLALNTIYDRHALAVGETMHVPAYGHFRGPEQRAAAGASGGRAGGPSAGPGGGNGNTRLAQYGAIERSTLPPPRGASSGYVSNVSYVPVPQNRPGPPNPPAPQRRPGAPPLQPQPAQQTSWLGWLGPSDARDPRGQSDAGAGSRGGFLWPVVGQVITPFGSSPGGGRNDGINIQAPRGTPVRASANGTVTYVGNELKGYGNLVLIRHDNGYVTAYAHSDTLVVERGERVNRGQIIGYTGTSGDVTQPQVHFELRVGTKPVDPKPYLSITS